MKSTRESLLANQSSQSSFENLWFDFVGLDNALILLKDVCCATVDLLVAKIRYTKLK
jgi:hypothetical protein